MSRRPVRRGGGSSSGSSSVHRGTTAASSFDLHRREGALIGTTSNTSARAIQPNCDELDRVLEQVIAAGGADGGHHTLSSTSPPGSFVSSSSSTNNKGLYKGLALEKGNQARGERLEVQITSETGRPSVQEQATALASEMGLACRECLPLLGDWRNVDVNLKKLAFERMKARLKLINLDEVITYACHLRHMGLIRRRWRYRVHQEFLLNGDDARPTHTTDADWESIKRYWQGLQDQRERHSSDPAHEKRSWSEIGETARSHVVNLHCTGPVAHATVRDELEETLKRPVGNIEFFERTRRKDVSTPDRPDGWLPGTKATHEKFVQLQNESIASGTPLQDNEVVDIVLNAANRSDYRPGASYGVKAVGRSSKCPGSKQQLRDELVSTQRKNDRLEEKMMMLMESHSKLIEDITQIKSDMALMARGRHDTSTNIGQHSSSQNPPSRRDDVE